VCSPVSSTSRQSLATRKRRKIDIWALEEIVIKVWLVSVHFNVVITRPIEARGQLGMPQGYSEMRHDGSW